MEQKKEGWALRRHFLRTCLVVTVLFFLYYSYLQAESFIRDPASLRSVKNVVRMVTKQFQNSTFAPFHHRKKKLVLLWTSYFSEKLWLPSTDELNCPVRDCAVTDDRSLLNESSALIIHWRNANPQDMPPMCSARQRTHPCPLWVLFNKESPPHTPRDRILSVNNSFHLTATYRTDSDLFAPYGKIVEREDNFTVPDPPRNRRLVCWLVSNCNTASRREEYVLQLKKYVPVDVFGACGTRSCPHADRMECYRWLSKHCKFYLSFENSLCTDYITEKLYNALSTDMVPVVMGGADYSRFLPPHSYIDVADFATPKSLAEYLVSVDNDHDKYLSYFQWKTKYVVQNVANRWYCDLCRKVQETKPGDVVPQRDVLSWWFEKSECLSLRELRERNHSPVAAK